MKRLAIQDSLPLRFATSPPSMPKLNASIFGECQAMLLNFDETLEKEFGVKYCLRETPPVGPNIQPTPPHHDPR
jgi:hypothetical protein